MNWMVSLVLSLISIGLQITALVVDFENHRDNNDPGNNDKSTD